MVELLWNGFLMNVIDCYYLFCVWGFFDIIKEKKIE